MTDRPVPQQRLAADLARLPAEAPLPRDAVPAWFEAFWEVVGQQWSSIDKHRLNKFLLLVRCVFTSQLRYARTREDVARALAEWPFEETGDLRRVPLGLRLHVLDIWVDELEREGYLAGGGGGDSDDSGDQGSTSRALVDSVGEMVKKLRWCPVKQVRERARASYDADQRLPWVEKTAEEEEEEEEGDGEWGGIDD